jgi:hypothetical protein
VPSTHRHHSPAGASPSAASGAALSTGALPNTTLKWCRNGELSRLDLERIVERLQQLDPTAHALHPSQFVSASEAHQG